MSVERQQRRPTQAMPPILRVGFRPFFLMGSIFAALAVVLWLAELTGVGATPGYLPAVDWHQHEMLFGFASAIVAGFLLTAIPNWTGRLPVNGLPLAGLAGIWLAGRLAAAAGDLIGSLAAALVDLAFLVVLAGLVAREIISGRNWRNLPPALLIGLLAIGNAVFYLEHQGGVDIEGLGTRIGIAALAMLLGLIGGRIVPSFTRNWMVKRQKASGETASLPSSFAHFDRLALLLQALALIAWILAPAGRLTGTLLVIAGIAHMVRLARWQGWRSHAEPLVLILHIGYGWLAAGLLLLGLANLAPPFSDLAAMHALTSGAFGTMMLAVMTRATLGHTGRALTADDRTILIYVAVTLGAIVRTVSPLLPDQTWLTAAGLLWAGAFMLFALIYGPMLITGRVEPKAN